MICVTYIKLTNVSHLCARVGRYNSVCVSSTTYFNLIGRFAWYSWFVWHGWFNCVTRLVCVTRNQPSHVTHLNITCSLDQAEWCIYF